MALDTCLRRRRHKSELVIPLVFEDVQYGIGSGRICLLVRRCVDISIVPKQRSAALRLPRCRAGDCAQGGGRRKTK